MKAIIKSREMAAATAECSVARQELAVSSPSSSQHSPQFHQTECRACGRSISFPVRSNEANLRFSSIDQQLHLCEACKKFYCRYRDKIQGETCSCGGSKGSSDTEKCRVCRYQRCKEAILDKRAAVIAAKSAPPPPPPPKKPAPPQPDKVDFSKLPCAVCGFSSSGFHFGVVSCEGCKGFFRRSVNKNYKIQYECKAVKEGLPLSPGELCPTNSNCRKCRLKRCLDAGMSLKEIAIGRHTLRRRAEIDAAIKRHSIHGSFLEGKVCRRKRAVSENGEDGEKIVSPDREMVSQSQSQDKTLSEDEAFSQSQTASESKMEPFSVESEAKMECSTPMTTSSDPGQFVPQSSNKAAAVSSSTTTTSELSENERGHLDKSLGGTSDWLIERTIESVAKLSTISSLKTVGSYDMTSEERVAERVSTIDTYVKCVTEFLTLLPGVSKISMADRIVLFTQGFFPVAAAQISLHFDVERQIPNHFSLVRDGPAWNMWARELPIGHAALENFLTEAGNRFVTAITNLQEFSLLCALLIFNPDTPNLESADAVRSVRCQYELALLHYFSKISGIRSEHRLGAIYSLLPFFRQASSVFHEMHLEIRRNHPEEMGIWTPLFHQMHTQIISLTPANYETPPSSNRGHHSNNERRIMATMEEEADTNNNNGNGKEEPSISSSATISIVKRTQHICRACGRSTSIKSPISPLPNRSSKSQRNNNSPADYQSIVLCDACKKFYCRYRTKIQEETCSCGGSTTVSGDKCRLCRYQRCEAAIAEKKALSAPKPPLSEQEAEPPLEKVDFAKLPCAVCGYSSSGFHFGIVSCEGCKGFFRRSMNRTYKIQYTCKGIKDATDRSGKKLCPSSSNCRKCRLQRCVDAGMSLKEISIGRHTVRRRAEIDAAIKRHFAQGSFLKTKLCRRKRPEGDKDNRDERDDDDSSEAKTPNTTCSLSALGQSKSPEVETPKSVQQGLISTKLECATPQAVFTPPSYDDNNRNLSSFMKPPSRPTVISDSPCSSAVSPMRPSGANTPSSSVYRFSERENNTLDRNIQESSDWLIERAVEASARLAGISTVKIVLTYELSMSEMVAERVRSLDIYVKCISEFITILPGINQISMGDRILLFTQGFFPITAAQLSLNFDVEQQIPNHLSLDREGPAWEIWAKEIPMGHMAIENFLLEAGNRLVTAVGNLQEFSLFCALILLNPDTPNLENVESVRCVRRRYELALFHYFSKQSGVRSEQRLGEIYQLFPFFRRSTILFHDFFTDIGINRPNDRIAWTPLFKQFHAQIVSLPAPCPPTVLPSPSFLEQQ